eukprot:TRINITY_DN1168_c0_g1_i1.p1 TRINITY_DN1168_c0_g1~~TRINITY_DN1168_c0_g1_i1.p1  ORF type:complete len:520 (+),score=82.95 TRINITY_DN1168_c0_g1_i1:38-1561(+)
MIHRAPLVLRQGSVPTLANSWEPVRRAPSSIFIPTFADMPQLASPYSPSSPWPAYSYSGAAHRQSYARMPVSPFVEHSREFSVSATVSVEPMRAPPTNPQRLTSTAAPPLPERVDLVFKGGGSKGVAFVGAMQALEETGLRPHRLIGTSAGSLFALLLALGCTSQEVLAILRGDGEAEFLAQRASDEQFLHWLFVDPPTKADIKTPTDSGLLGSVAVAAKRMVAGIEDVMNRHALTQAYNLRNNGGMWTGDRLIEWLNAKVRAKTGINTAEPTLKELFDWQPETIVQGERIKREFTAVAANIDGEKRLVLNHRTFPNLPVAWAVRMSAALPFAFANVRWDSKWGEDQFVHHGASVVDGGIVDNFPLDLLVEEDQFRAFIGEKSQWSQNIPILAFALDTSAETNLDPMTPPSDSLIGDLAMASYISKIFNTMMDYRENDMLRLHRHVIVHCPVKNVDTLDMNMDEARRNALVAVNRKAVLSFIRGESDDPDRCWRWGPRGKGAGPHTH